MNEMLASTLCAPIEALINAVLKQDPASALQLQAYRGKALRVECTSPIKLVATLVVEEQGISLRSVYETEPDAAISASAGSFVSLLTSDSQTGALFSPAVALSGDTQLVQALHRIIGGLEIDWEGHFASVFGDIATHQLAEFAKRARRWGKNSREAVLDDVEEYLHEEARLLPSKSEVAHFSTRIDELKLRLDRINARTQRLGAKITEA
jgi:ubiquinone biosynthesis protein UbiJ